MANAQSRQAFIKSEKGVALRAELEAMVKSRKYNTRLYSLTSDPKGVHFIEKHMTYMSSYLTMDHMQYVSNLRLMTKITKK